MQRHARILLAVVAGCAAASACAADDYRFADLLQTKWARESLDPGVGLYFGDRAPPDVAELARPDTYTSRGISISPFGGSERHCVEAFQNTITRMVNDAKQRGYDAIVGIRVVEDDRPLADADGFRCTPGYKTTALSLTSRFAMTAAAAKRRDDDEARAAALPDRPPAKNVVRIPLRPLLDSSAAQKILGADIAAYAGLDSPPYVDRFGPIDVSDTAARGAGSDEDACAQAALQALASMVEEARDKQYDAIIRLRSYLDDEYAPYAAHVECQVGWRSVKAVLQASLARRR